MKKKISIAIDGPSAAGKSTIAKMVAKKENFIYIDTGAMYRSVAFYCIKNHIDLNDEQAVEQAISNIQIRLTADNKVYLNDEDVSLQIRTDEVSLGASCVSKYQAVRTFLVDEQRKMAETGNVILDGRDIGTVVLPHADLKIYQIASVETRAKRRYLENKERGLEADLETIKKEIDVTCEEMTLDQARASGAKGIFANKYGDKVKVYTIGNVSKEICGGPHANNTRELKSFKIIKEESSSSGVRRIKAVIG